MAVRPPGHPDLGPGLTTAVERLRAVSATLTAFDAAGCTVTDQFLACTVAIPPVQSEGLPYRALIDAITDVADVHLRFERRPISFELTAVAGASLDFMAEPSGDPATAFGGEELERAERAWKGDIAMAMSLAGEWSGDLSVNLAAPLQANDPGRAWRAVRTAAVVVQELAAYPWWRTGELIREDKRQVVVAIVAEAPVDLQTPSFALVSLDRLVGNGPVVPGTTLRRAQVVSSAAGQLPDEIPLPEDLEPTESALGAEGVAESLRQRADACAWAWLSNATRVTDAAPLVATLEYFGYRRRTFQLGSAGYVGEAGERAVQLYMWATQEISPDRVLAIRQVVSLHDRGALPGRPGDIVRAAEPLYQALRAGEVAAALETQRQARSIAVDAARGGAEGAQAAAKSTAERTIASLAAVLGTSIANSTAILSDADARGITLGIAGLFMFLAAWTIFVEGPTMRAPLTSFAADLRTIGYLLSETDREEILRMQALKTAANAVLRVRIAAPIVYITGAVVSVAVAHYAFGLFPSALG